MRDRFDVAVTGAGPVGAACALAYAREGARVVLLESNPRARQRFAGEWLHPLGVSVLDELRAGRFEDSAPRIAYGFVVFAEDGGDPIELPYAPGEVAVCTDHGQIVTSLRRHAIQAGVDYRPDSRVIGLDETRIQVEDRIAGHRYWVHADRIVGADGRGSMTRAYVGAAPSTVLSHMASLLMTDVELPHEGFGHVVLGGPGPILMYRVAAGQVRVCIDVPLSVGREGRRTPYLRAAYGPILPPQLRDAFERALTTGPIGWADTRFQPRGRFGRGRVALIGDALGHVHPLTASGMTQGFLDVRALVASPSLEAYRARREPESYMPELLSNALYSVLQRRDASATSLRQAIYRTWREDAGERERTMSLLLGGRGQVTRFARSFSKIASGAVLEGMLEDLREGRILRLLSRVGDFSDWARWPAAAIAPAPLRRRIRPSSDSENPFARRPLPTDETTPATSSAMQRDVAALGERAVDAVLDGLLVLAPRVATWPKLRLAVSAIPLIWAIDPAVERRSIAGRLQLGRRRVAQEGVAVLLEGASDADTPVALHLADLLLMHHDRHQARPERPARLADAIDYLSRCRTADGGFGPRPGDASELTVTCRCLRALAATAAEEGEEAEACRALLSTAESDLARHQRSDGGFGELETTIEVLEALSVVAPQSPITGAATAALVALQGDDGAWRDADSEDGMPRTAADDRCTVAAMAALLSAPEPVPAVDRGMPALIGAVERLLPHAEAHPREIADDAGVRTTTAHVVRALGLALRRLRRDEPQRRIRFKPARSVIAPALDQERERDWEFCRESVGTLSDTLSRPIEFLPDSLQVAVTCSYLLCRIADTIEDEPDLELERRDDMFATLLEMLAGRCDPAALSGSFFALHGSADVPDRVLGRNVDRVMRVFRWTPEPMQRVTERRIGEMVRGMLVFSHREVGPDGMRTLETMEDLERYCFYSAGVVGHLLTDLFLEHGGPLLDEEAQTAMRRYAESFGSALRRVDLLAKVGADLQAGVCTVPRTLLDDHGLAAADLSRPAARGRTHALLAPLMALAGRGLRDGMRYTSALPRGETGIRMFCLVPLFFAAWKLRRLEDGDLSLDSAEVVRVPPEEADAILTDCLRDCEDDHALTRSLERLLGAGIDLEHEGIA